jgi:hypothetical protein
MKLRILTAVCIALLFTLSAFGQEATKTQENQKILKPQQQATMEGALRMRLQLAPGEHVINIAAAAFINESPSLSNWSNQGDRVGNSGPGGSRSFVAPLILPQGARVTRMAVYVNEFDDNHLTSVWLVRQALYVPPGEGRGGDIPAQVACTGVPGDFNLHPVLNVENLVIDNLSNTYYLKVNLSERSSFRCVLIFYRLD